MCLPPTAIFPDKRYYNVDTGEFGSMEARWEGDSLTFCNGEIYGESAEANTIRKEGANWEEFFRIGDAVTINGCTKNTGNNQTIIIREIDGDKLRFYEHSFSLTGDNDEEYEETGKLTIQRLVPSLKYVCENENRLWGCTNNVIYACKQGDIFNWYVMDGISSDSWSVDTGSAGDFTGCVSFLGYPTFFKENNIYKVYGTLPSNFQLMGAATLGLAQGCAGSLAIAGETLFYLSRSGVMAYSGGIPLPISEVFGTECFQDAVAGSDGLKYYISMRDSDDQWRLYVFDTQRGVWHIEDEVQATHFARMDGCLYFLKENGEIWVIGDEQRFPDDTQVEKDFPWMAEFADFTEDDPNTKGVTKLQLRIELGAGAVAQAWIQFDSDGVWHPVSKAIGEGIKRSCYLPITPRRCDHYRIRITGTGECRLFSLTRESYSGSELKYQNGRR